MSLEKGAKTAVITCMGVEEGDKVVIVSDRNSQEIGKELRKVALDITPHVRFFNLDLYGERPIQKYPDAIEEATKEADVTFWTCWSYEGELETIRRPFISDALVGGRHAHMVNITKEVVEDALAVDYNEIEEFTYKLADELENTDQVKVKNEQGTDITVEFSDRWKLVPSSGICKEPGHWNNLPDGEVYTAPIKMDGQIVADGVLGDYLGNKYSHADLQEDPLTIEIETKEKAEAVGVSCGNKELKEEVEEYLELNPCSSYVGEYGMGTNVFLEELSGNMLQDEKFPGVHVAFGDPMSDETYADWTCPEHLDMILTRCNVWFDDKKVMEEGEYII